MKKKHAIYAVLITALGFIGLICLIPSKTQEVENDTTRHLSNVDIVREITQIPNLPAFTAKAFKTTDKKTGQEKITFECDLDDSISFDRLFEEKEKHPYWYNEDKNGYIYFHRGWSKSAYMKIPQGIREEYSVTIIYESSDHFEMVYESNPCGEYGDVEKDSLNHFLGITMPDFTIVNFFAPNQTTLRMNDSLSMECYHQLERQEHLKCDEHAWCGCKDSALCAFSINGTQIDIDWEYNTITLER